MSASQSSNITEQYLQAIGLEKARPDIAFLRALQLRHVSTFAFSSVGPMLGNQLPLNLSELFDRIVTRRRGGYCFEHNGLMYEVLKALGFNVSLYLGRVIYNQDIHPGLTHRITLVELQGADYVFDVGFGPLGPRFPVNMNGDVSQELHRQFWVAELEPGVYHLQTLKDDEPFSLYKFEKNRYSQADCEIGHFYSHKHPNASFVNDLVVSLMTNSGVRSLRNLDMTNETVTGSQVQRLADHDQLQSVLEQQFNITVTDHEAGQLFEKLRKKHPPD